MKTLILITVLACTLLSGEMEERDRIIREATDLFLNRKFDTLSKISETYLKERSRTRSGRMKLNLFYIGIMKSRKKKDIAALKKIAEAWIAEAPDSPSAGIAYAFIRIIEGWIGRGDGPAIYTTPKQWEKLRRSMEEARTWLQDHKSGYSSHPEWYVAMLDIARGENWDKKRFYALLDEAINRHPRYAPVYYQALYRMSPRWGDFGKEEIEHLARKALEATREKEGYSLYARVYWAAAQIIYKENLFTDSDVDWNTMRRGFEDILRRYPSRYNLNHFAYFSCLAGDRETTRRLLEKIGEDPLELPWKYHDRSFERCRKLAREAPKSRNEYLREIRPEDLDRFIAEKTDEKPAFIHFSSYRKGCGVCDPAMLEKIAGKYHDRMTFVSVNTAEGYDRLHMFLKYAMRHPPYSLIVFRKKIIVRRDERLYRLQGERYARFRPGMIERVIKTFLSEKKDDAYFRQFKESICDRASLFNSEENIRSNMAEYATVREGYKATAAAVDPPFGRWAYGRSLRANSQKEANEKAMKKCNDNRKKFKIRDRCRLHMIGDRYVYETPEFPPESSRTNP